jgi:sodium/proline symporter
MTLSAIIILAAAFVFIGWRVQTSKETIKEEKEGQGSTFLQTSFSLFTVIGAGEYGFAISLILASGLLGLSFLLGLGFAFIAATLIVRRVRYMAHNVQPVNPKFDGYVNYSTPDYYAQIGGKFSSALVTTTDAFAFIGILLVQFVVGGTILSLIGDISYSSAVLLMVVTVCLYSLMGGLRAIFHTDIFQGILMWVALLSALFYVIAYSPVENNVIDSVTSLISSTGGLFDDLTPLVLFILTAAAAFSGPDVWQRISTAHTAASSKKALIWSGFALMIFGLIVLGFAGDIRLNPVALNSGDAFMEYLKQIYEAQLWPPLVSALFAIGLLSAFVSTADTSLVLLTTLTQNELRRQNYWNSDSNGDSFVKESKWILLGYSFIGLVLALFSPGIVDIFGIVIGLLSLVGIPTLITLLGYGTSKTLPVVFILEILVFVIVSFFPFTDNPLALLFPLVPAVILFFDRRT